MLARRALAMISLSFTAQDRGRPLHCRLEITAYHHRSFVVFRNSKPLEATGQPLSRDPAAVDRERTMRSRRPCRRRSRADPTCQGLNLGPVAQAPDMTGECRRIIR